MTTVFGPGGGSLSHFYAPRGLGCISLHLLAASIAPFAANERVRPSGAVLRARTVREGRHRGGADGVEIAARAHLHVVAAQITKDASDRNAAAPEAVVHVLDRGLAARARAGPAPGEERAVRRSRRGHHGR